MKSIKSPKTITFYQGGKRVTLTQKQYEKHVGAIITVRNFDDEHEDAM